MLRLVIRRLLLAVPLLFLVSVLTFALIALTPGNAALEILGGNATPTQVTALQGQMGLNLPLPVQYWRWLSQALQGNLGSSLFSSQPVLTELNSRISVTLTVIVSSTLVAGTVGIALGVAGAVWGGAIGRVTDVVSLFGFAVPNFWLGLVLVSVFAVSLRLLPATGFVPLSQSPLGWLRSLVLPVVTLSAAGVTGVAKQTRDSMRDILHRDFVDALRAEGVPERSIVFRHALKNASLPVLTMVSLFFVSTLGGAVIVEQLFGLPGVGSLAVQATSTHDLAMIQGVAVYFALIVIAVNLLVDLSYGWLDPRVRS